MKISKGVTITPQKVVCYGPEGIGKSTFASMFPDPLFIDVEASTRMLDVARIDPPPMSWTGILETVKEFLSERPSDFQTLVIDTADWCEKLCVAHICAKYQKSGIEEFGFGKGYVYLYEEFGKLLNSLEDVIKAGYNVVLLAHAKMRKFEQPDEMGSYDRWEMKLSKNVAPIVKEWADLVLFANYKTTVITTQDNKHKVQGGKRVMYTSHHACWDAKNRHGLPDELPFSYEEIAHCIPASGAGGSKPEVGIPASEEITVAPARTESPAPAAQTERTAQPNGLKPLLSQDIPKALAELMTASQITEDEVLRVIGSTGYFTADTPWSVMQEQGFVDGWVIPNWTYIKDTVEADPNRLPF